MEQKKTKYLNPYIGGVLLGIVLLASNFISGRGLGASGAIKECCCSINHYSCSISSEKMGFIKEFREAHPGNPMKTWLVFEMTGVLVGGFLSGAFAGRLKLKVEHSPKITSKKTTFCCLNRRSAFWFWSGTWPGMYKWIST